MKKLHVILVTARNIFLAFLLSAVLLLLIISLFVAEYYTAAVPLVILLLIGLLSEIDYYKSEKKSEHEKELYPGQFDKYYHVK